MGKKLMSDMQATPLVNVTEQAGLFLQGVLKNRKEVKTQYGDRPVYTLELENTDMRTVIKEGKEFIDKDVEQGQYVAIFAPTLLDRALIQAAMGDKVKIIYLGLGKAAKKGRNAPHMFDVEVL